MSSNNQNAAVANNANTEAPEQGLGSRIASAATNAAASAGTPSFASDMAKLDEALKNAKVKFELPSALETAKTAAVYAGVTCGVFFLFGVAVTLMGGGNNNSSSN